MHPRGAASPRGCISRAWGRRRPRVTRPVEGCGGRGKYAAHHSLDGYCSFDRQALPQEDARNSYGRSIGPFCRSPHMSAWTAMQAHRDELHVPRRDEPALEDALCGANPAHAAHTTIGRANVWIPRGRHIPRRKEDSRLMPSPIDSGRNSSERGFSAAVRRNMVSPRARRVLAVRRWATLVTPAPRDRLARLVHERAALPARRPATRGPSHPYRLRY